MLKSRTFRLIVSAIGALAVVSLAVFMLLSLAARAEEPRNATPAEIAQAALEGQIEALRKAGFDRECLFGIEVFGRICIERCVTKDAGFFLDLRTDPPTCFVRNCICEDGRVPDVPDEPS